MVVEEGRIRVAVRVRPLTTTEQIRGDKDVIGVLPDAPEIKVNESTSYTYDYVYDKNATQEQIFRELAVPLIDQCFEGFNMTLLAYGQTGSGKTYTMGTAYTCMYTLNSEVHGILPRAVNYLFSEIERKISEASKSNLPKPAFEVTVSFLEIYQEKPTCLLTRKKSHITFHEKDGRFFLNGLEEEKVQNAEDLFSQLKRGSSARKVAATKMNDVSSRSHAIFTINLKTTTTATVDGDVEVRSCHSKLNFVDLAGSERMKRTGATGTRAREAIDINSGLLVLSNCVAALGDPNLKKTHVPYRESPLTKYLKDSLGGNSRTIMVVNISPSDKDFLETHPALLYANRARNIKNKIRKNEDKTSQQLAGMRRKIEELELQLEKYSKSDDPFEFELLQKENSVLLAELKNLKEKYKEAEALKHNYFEKCAILQAKLDLVESGGTICDIDTENNEELNSRLSYTRKIEELSGQIFMLQGDLKKQTRMTCAANPSVFDQKIAEERVKVFQRYENLYPNPSAAGGDSMSQSMDVDLDENICDNDVDEEIIRIDMEVEAKEKILLELEKKNDAVKRYEAFICNLEEQLRAKELEQRELASKLSQVQNDNDRQSARKLENEVKVLKEKLRTEREKSKRSLERSEKNAKIDVTKLKKQVIELRKEKVHLLKTREREMKAKHAMEFAHKKKEAKADKELRKKNGDLARLKREGERLRSNLDRSRRENEVLKKRQQRVREVVTKNRHTASIEKNYKSLKQLMDTDTDRQILTDKYAKLYTETSNNIHEMQLNLEADQKKIEKLTSKAPRESTRLQLEDMRKNVKDWEELIREKEEEMQEYRSYMVDYDVGYSIADENAQRFVNILESENANDQYVVGKLAGELSRALTNYKRLQKELEERRTESRLDKDSLAKAREEILQNQKIIDLLRKDCKLNDASPSDDEMVGSKCGNLSAEVDGFESGEFPPIASPHSKIANNSATVVKARKLTYSREDLLLCGAGIPVNSSENTDARDSSSPISTDALTSSSSCSDSAGTVSPTKFTNKRSPSHLCSEAMPVISSVTQNLLLRTPKESDTLTKRFAKGNRTFGTTPRKMKVYDRLAKDVHKTPESKGMGNIFTPKKNVKSRFIHLHHCATGHNGAITSVDATEESIVTGSQNLVFKVWDLQKGTDVYNSDGFGSSVSKVKFLNSNSNMVVSVNRNEIWLTDIRSNAGGVNISAANSECNDLASYISNLAVVNANNGSDYILSTTKNLLQMWDVRQRKCFYTETLPAQWDITSMDVFSSNNASINVAVGARNHEVQVFEYDLNNVDNPLAYRLKPNTPHLDNVTSLLFENENVLFSACRSGYIKRRELSNVIEGNEFKQDMKSLHGVRITGLALFPVEGLNKILVSSASNGQLTLWNIDNCTLMDEIEAHDLSITGIATNSKSLFTVSEDKKIKIWKIKE